MNQDVVARSCCFLHDSFLLRRQSFELLCPRYASRYKSLASSGTREGLFHVVYRFENEQLLELINRTVHAAALSALVETVNAYRFYFAVYVRSVSRFTPI